MRRYNALVFISMTPRRLEPQAHTVLALQTLYHTAESFCAVFVAVYLWVNSHDFGLVCMHYLTLYTVTPIVYMFAGWYSQARDRLHVFRLGLVLHAVYYGAILLLREQSTHYVVPLGVLLGVAWGFYWPGANTFNYDVTVPGKREYYFGYLHTLVGGARLISPFIAGAIIYLSGETLTGYHRIFGLVIVLYIICFMVSFRMPPDDTPRPFNIKRALFPGKDQRDWRIIMMAASTLAGAYYIFQFFLGLLMFMVTENEFAVGGYTSFQALATLVTAYILGRIIVPKKRLRFMGWATILLVSAGVLISFKLTAISLLAFGLLRSVAGPMFAISHFGFRMDTISHSVLDDSQRIEYLCAWEVPLALGRIVMMTLMMVLYDWFTADAMGVRMALLILCSLRILTYFILSRSHTLRGVEAPHPAPPMP